MSLAFEIRAATLHSDSGWDTRDYHLYNPFALLHGKWRIDIAPAHMQTYFSPIMDLPYYLLVRHIDDTRVLNCLLELPRIFAINLAFVLALRLLRATDLLGCLTAATAVLIGATGAAAFPYSATGSSDMIAVSLVMAGLLLLIPAEAHQLPSERRICLAGVLFGGAVGLKLTFACAAGGLCLAVFALPFSRYSTFLRRALALSFGGLLGSFAVGGWWWIFSWYTWGSPVFPLFNNIFHSPLLPALPFGDPSYRPKSWLSALLLPVLLTAPYRWSAYFHQFVGETYIRDPRFCIAIIASIFLLIRILMKRGASDNRVHLIIFFLTSFVLWELEFSIFRYLSSIELLTGVLIILCADSFANTHNARRAVFGGSVAFLVFLATFTFYPKVDRALAANVPILAYPPQVAQNGMVVLLDESPLAYLALFEPTSVRFIGANNSFIHPNGRTLLERDVALAIASQAHDLWGLETPEDWVSDADKALRAYGLQRTECVSVRTTLVDSDRVRMCKLIHVYD